MSPRPRACLRRWHGGPTNRLRQLFGADAEVDIARRHFTFRFRSAEDYFETFKAYYGPLVKAWGALDADGRASLRQQLVALADGANRKTNSALTIASEYLEVVITRNAHD